MRTLVSLFVLVATLLSACLPLRGDDWNAEAKLGEVTYHSAALSWNDPPADAATGVRVTASWPKQPKGRDTRTIDAPLGRGALVFNFLPADTEVEFTLALLGDDAPGGAATLKTQTRPLPVKPEDCVLYVDTIHGHNANPGTAERPLKSVEKIYAQGTTTVYVSGPIYPKGPMTLFNGGKNGGDYMNPPHRRFELVSWHTIDPAKAPATLVTTRPFVPKGVEPKTSKDRGDAFENVLSYTVPKEALPAKEVWVGRGEFRPKKYKPIPTDGLEPGLAFDKPYVDSFRAGERRFLMREVDSIEAVNAKAGSFFVDRPNNTVYVRTVGGDPIGRGNEPVWMRRDAGADSIFIHGGGFNIGTVVVRGFRFGPNVQKNGVVKGNLRSLYFNNHGDTVVEDCVFYFSTFDDVIAFTRPQKPDPVVTVRRCQFFGIGKDGGMCVAASLNSKHKYKRVVYEDNIVHYGFSMLYHDDGSAADHESRWPAGLLGCTHHGDGKSGALRRSIALHYRLKPHLWLPPAVCQLMAHPSANPENPLDAGQYRWITEDIYVEHARGPHGGNLAGHLVRNSYFGLTAGQLLGNPYPALFENCVFEWQASDRGQDAFTVHIRRNRKPKPAVGGMRDCIVRVLPYKQPTAIVSAPAGLPDPYAWRLKNNTWIVDPEAKTSWWRGADTPEKTSPDFVTAFDGSKNLTERFYGSLADWTTPLGEANSFEQWNKRHGGGSSQEKALDLPEGFMRDGAAIREKVGRD